MTQSNATPPRRPEREDRQPLAEISKSEARDKKPDPELGEHGPLAGETGDRLTNAR